MAAPLIHCYETAGSSGAQTSITVPKPGSGSTAGPDGAKNPVAGDYLLVVLCAEVSNPGAAFFAEADRPDSSWEFLGNQSGNAPDCAIAAYLHKVDGNEGSDFTFGTWASNDCAAICILLSGVHATPADASHLVGSGVQVGGSETTLDVPGVTTTVDDCVGFAFCAFDGGDDGGYGVSGTGWTELAEFRNGTGSGNSSGCVAYRKMSGQGATGTCTFTTQVSDGRVGFQFAIAPAATPADDRARVSWAELETTDPPRRARVTWGEVELPEPSSSDRRGIASWAELEVGTAPRRARATWAEMQVGTAPRRASITVAEMELPEFVRRAVVMVASAEVPDVAGSGYSSASTNEEDMLLAIAILRLRSQKQDRS